MSVTTWFYAIRDETFDNAETYVGRFYKAETDGLHLDEYIPSPPQAPVEPKKSFFARFFKSANPNSQAPTSPSPPDFIPFDQMAGEGRDLGIDKSLDTIHFLLTGNEAHFSPEHASDPDISFLGSNELSEVPTVVDPDYCVFFRATHVKHFAKALSAIGSDDLRKNFNLEQITKAVIYPNNWKNDPQGELDFHLEHFEQLVDFLKSCADDNLGILMFQG